MARRRLNLRPRKAVPGAMNQTETAYLEEVLGKDPTVVEARFEAVTLRLAKATAYRPDFYVLRKEGLFAVALELHEVKGGWVDAKSRTKIKVAAALFPEIRFFWIVGKKLSKKRLRELGDAAPLSGWEWKTEEIEP